jgi:hypothetical protein
MLSCRPTCHMYYLLFQYSPRYVEINETIDEWAALAMREGGLYEMRPKGKPID